jgi:hypothetical protein
MVVLHELFADAQLGEDVATIGLEKEASLVTVYDRLEQDRPVKGCR